MNEISVDQLAAALSGEDAGHRATAAESLAQRGPACRPACVSLVRACGTDPVTLEWASAALEQMGPPPPDAIPDLIALLDDRTDDVAYWAATLLGRAEREAVSAGDALASVIASSREPIVRERAAWAVGKIGCSSPALVQALRAACEGGHPRLARLAGEALR